MPDRRLRSLVAIFGLTFGSWAVGGPQAGATLRVTDLKCEADAEPLGIDAARPRLSWVLAGEARGQRQSAWEVLVATSPDRLEPGLADLWDSGRVASDQSSGVAYGGSPLASSQRVFWKVRAWDGDGRSLPWSEPAAWTMGILAPGDWKGIWIAAPGATESLLLRREFVVRPGLRRAVAHVCGLGQYELLLNGAKVGDDLLAPGWTDYDKTALYDTKDVTALLREGRNAAGLVLGNGMYDIVRRNRFVKFAASRGPLRAIAQLRLEYAGGSVEFVGTDETWRTTAGPITCGNIYSGEDWDARLEPRGWSGPFYDDSGWTPAVACRTDGALRGHEAAAEPVRAIEARRPVSIARLSDGSLVYDLGQNASYMPRIRVSGPAGSAVRLTPAEVVNADGTINGNTMDGKNRGSAWWQYTKATAGEETWMPRFYYVGCRYLKAEFFPPGPAPFPAGTAERIPRLESVEGIVVHSAAAPAGTFACSNGLLNRIRDLVRWAQRSNMVSIFTDCPHREKLGWLEQLHLDGPAVRYEFDATRLFAKAEHDMADAQTADGLVPNIAPEFVRFEGAFRSAAEWGAAFILVPWQQYQFTGDTGLLLAHYGGMKRYFAYLESRADDGVLSEGLGDWYDLGPEVPGPAQLTPAPVTASAFYYFDASVLGQIASVIGRPEDAADYAARAERIRESYNRHFFHPGAGSYAGGSQCANALPLALGIAEEGDRRRVLAALVRDVEQRGVTMTTGDVGFRFLLRALADGGRSDLIYRMIDQDEKPGYGYEIKHGATSLTESWDANLNSSHNHWMLGEITEWFYRDLAGIDADPTGPGFKKILLHPHPVGDLAWVEASYRTIHGPVSVRWERDGKRFFLRAEIPANTTATVFVPARAAATVLEGGAPAGSWAGVTFLRSEGDAAVYAIESGNYAFESRW